MQGLLGERDKKRSDQPLHFTTCTLIDIQFRVKSCCELIKICNAVYRYLKHIIVKFIYVWILKTKQ